MSITKEKKITVDGKTFFVNAELYNSTKYVIEDATERPVRISGYKLEGIYKGWYGVDSWDEAIELLRDGYKPVVERLKATLKSKTDTEKKTQVVNAVQGFMPSVPLALKNIPQCMLTLDRNVPAARVIDLYYDMTANSDTDIDQFIKAGEAMLSVIIGLEKQGYRFNLYAVQSYTRHSDYKADFLCVKVKSSDKPIDIKRMSFALIHPAFFRVIGFDWESKSPIARDIGSGRGRGFYYDFSSKEKKEIIKEIFGENAHYLPGKALIDGNYNPDIVKEALENAKDKD